MRTHFIEDRNITRFHCTSTLFVSEGNHGYNPENVSDMWPFFIAAGPAFKVDHHVPSIDMVDIYSLMCQILDLVPVPNMGNLDNVRDLLKHPPVWYKTFETTAVTCK